MGKVGLDGIDVWFESFECDVLGFRCWWVGCILERARELLVYREY